MSKDTEGMKQSAMEHTIERNEIKGSNRVIPFAILFLFIGITVLSIVVLITSSSKRLMSEYLGICEALAISFEGHLQVNEIPNIQKVINDFCKVDKRIVRLSVIGQGDDGKYHHLASNWPTRLNTPAHQEDLEVIHNGVQVVVKETIEGKDYYDITYPLHDKEGIVLGCIGYTATRKPHLDWLQIGVYFGSSILLFIMVIINFRGREKRILWLLSEQKRQEQLLLESSKQQEELKRLKSLKTMAGAIAHRFNNAMMAVQGNLELMTCTLPADSDEHKMASNAAQAAGGAAQVGSMMLSYVGQQPLKLKEIPLETLVSESVTSLKNLLQPSISLQFTPPDRPLYCSVDQKQIKEVIDSIITNAVESLSDGSGTIEITFGTDYFTTDSFPISFQSGNLQDGMYTFCQIKDSGHGINSKDLSRIFEPFYTTRFVGRGLGLALTVGIMQSHYGALTVESLQDNGTIVKLLLPSISSTKQTTLPSDTAFQDEAAQLLGNILLADDEEMVLDVGRKMLEILGFTVHTAMNGQEAVNMVGRQDIDFVAVVLDISMPEMDGIKAMNAIKGINPALPILLSSGYAEDDLPFQEGEKNKSDGFLRKPFQLSDMRRSLEKLLF